MPESTPTISKRPIFGVVSWLVPCGAWLVTYFAISASRARGGFMPGLGEAIVGVYLVALSAFGFGTIAIFRGERYRWLGLVPALSGLAVLIYWSWYIGPF